MATWIMQKLNQWTFPGKLKDFLPLVFLILLTAPVLLSNLSVYPPPWFDEGYRMNAARTLADRGVYGTYTTNGYLPFDPGITSGPMEIGLIALSFKLFGEGVIQARLVIVFFSFWAIILVYLLAKRLYGTPAALFITLVVLAYPPINHINLLLVGRQILSEVPSLALILTGLLLWFISWEKHPVWMGLVAGFFLGMGLLSKSQTAIMLAPAIMAISLGRWILHRSNFFSSMAAIAGLCVPLIIWALATRLGTPVNLLSQNQAILAYAIRTNLLTDLMGSNISRGGIVVALLMGVGGVFAGLRTFKTRLRTNQGWAEATLGLFVLLYLFWFVGLSIGWTRYAFIGLIVGLILVGKLIWDILLKGISISNRWFRFSRYFREIIMVGLASSILWMGLRPVSPPVQGYHTQEVAEYIRKNIPENKIIESWEWELDVPSGHWNYHHPPQLFLFESIWQLSHQKRFSNMNYNLLQADPDYLILGPYSIYVQIYDPGIVARDFIKLTEIGPYQIYKRNRAASITTYSRSP